MRYGIIASIFGAERTSEGAVVSGYRESGIKQGQSGHAWSNNLQLTNAVLLLPLEQPGCRGFFSFTFAPWLLQRFNRWGAVGRRQRAGFFSLFVSLSIFLKNNASNRKQFTLFSLKQT